MTINLKELVRTVKGEPYKSGEDDLTLGMVMDEVLATDTNGGKMKMWTLAQKSYNDETLEVDTADFTLIKKAFETSKTYGSSNIILGQCLELLESMK